MGVKNGKSDLHCHTIHSSDGEFSFQGLLERAKMYGLEYFSTTDHNNMAYILNYLNNKNLKGDKAYHQMGDTKYVPGVEVTCRINDKNGLNKKGNASKVHILVYSPILDEENLFYKLIKAKHINDISYDFGSLMEIAKLKDIELNELDIREFVKNMRDIESGFTTMGKSTTYDFLSFYYPGLFENYEEYENLYEEIRESSRLNLDARDVINFAHNSGGISILAHPQHNMNRMAKPEKALDCLMDYGLDGFEMFCPTMKQKGKDIVESVRKRHKAKNSMIYTGGSDFHRIVGWRDLGRYQDKGGDKMNYVYTRDLPVFSKEIERLQKAREEGEITHRVYDKVSEMKLYNKYKKIENFVNENRLIDGDYPIYNNDNDYFIPELEERIREF